MVEHDEARATQPQGGETQDSAASNHQAPGAGRTPGLAHAAPTVTASVERARPRRNRPKNGPTSRRDRAGSPPDHTQCRLSWTTGSSRRRSPRSPRPAARSSPSPRHPGARYADDGEIHRHQSGSGIAAGCAGPRARGAGGGGHPRRGRGRVEALDTQPRRKTNRPQWPASKFTRWSRPTYGSPDRGHSRRRSSAGRRVRSADPGGRRRRCPARQWRARAGSALHRRR